MNFNTQNTIQQYPIINSNTSVDVVLIGAGIMSVTLGTFLSILEPSWIIHLYERLSKPAQESSNAWNNAGTGHAAFCELHYTAYNNKNDSINIEKAISINSQFELSLQFWSYLTQTHILHNPKSFINNIPHMSFVWGKENIYFLKKRFQILKQHEPFNEMIYSEDPKQIHSWVPLIMEGRNKNQKVAATYMKMGTDINFGEITKQLLTSLNKNCNFQTYLQHHVQNIQYCSNNNWNVKITDIHRKQTKYINARYVFVGGGGQTLNILQDSKIQEIMGYAGFPVGGKFLITHNPKIINQHSAKVYGKTSINMPPMSVPHIDTRILHDNKVLLFGPFATFSSKFLKYGSWLDLFRSINIHNLIPIMQSGMDNLGLIKYLINQVIMSHKDQIALLKEYYPNARSTDWTLINAGQRVQIIKKNNQNRGILQFGTEIIHSKNNTLTALLGASPGASISVSIAIKILRTMFYKKFLSDSWKKKLLEMVPSYMQQFQKITEPFSSQTKKTTRENLKLLHQQK